MKPKNTVHKKDNPKCKKCGKPMIQVPRGEAEKWEHPRWLCEKCGTIQEGR
jgi:uncharacterized protein with PIN domain